MTSGRELFINAVRLIPIGGSTNTPTVLFYEGREPLIGYDALERAGGSNLLNEDFKLDLGRLDPASIQRAKFDTASGGQRAALGLANDFVNVPSSMFPAASLRVHIASPNVFWWPNQLQ